MHTKDDHHVHCSNNLKQLGLMLRIYAETYGERRAMPLPPNLRILTKEMDLDKSMLQWPKELYGDIPKDKEVDYEYVVAGEDLGQLDDHTVLAYHEHDRENLINLLFKDSHVEEVEADSIKQLLRE